jgi:hypothetical protein
MSRRYVKHTAFDPNGLSDDVIRAYAPSVFAEQPYEGMSAKYRFFPTSEILAGMRQQGFVPVQAGQGATRVPGKADFTKHIIRFRHPDLTAQYDATMGREEIPEIVLRNGHDGTAAYDIFAGIFRMICMNGCVAASQDFGHIHVRHSGRKNLLDDVIEGSYTVVEDLPKLATSVEHMKSVTVSFPQQLAFAKAALVARDTAIDLDPQRLLTARRYDDHTELGGQRTVWKTFNVVQENLVRGGAQGRGATGRRASLRAVTNPNADLKLNRALWTLADELAKVAK